MTSTSIKAPMGTHPSSQPTASNKYPTPLTSEIIFQDQQYIFLFIIIIYLLFPHTQHKHKLVDTAGDILATDAVRPPTVYGGWFRKPIRSSRGLRKKYLVPLDAVPDAPSVGILNGTVNYYPKLEMTRRIPHVVFIRIDVIFEVEEEKGGAESTAS